MMLRATLFLLILPALISCAARSDPRLQAAEDFRSTAYELIARDEKGMQRLNALSLGMSDEEVLRAAGPPSRRETLSAGTEAPREVWTYGGELRTLGVLTFESGRLVQIRVD